LLVLFYWKIVFIPKTGEFSQKQLIFAKQKKELNSKLSITKESNL